MAPTAGYNPECRMWSLAVSTVGSSLPHRTGCVDGPSVGSTPCVGWSGLPQSLLSLSAGTPAAPGGLSLSFHVAPPPSTRRELGCCPLLLSSPGHRSTPQPPAALRDDGLGLPVCVVGAVPTPGHVAPGSLSCVFLPVILPCAVTGQNPVSRIFRLCVCAALVALVALALVSFRGLSLGSISRDRLSCALFGSWNRTLASSVRSTGSNRADTVSNVPFRLVHLSEKAFVELSRFLGKLYFSPGLCMWPGCK